VLDGDNVRHGLHGDLGFSDADREENIRRLAEVTALFVDAGLIVITAFISPFRAGRGLARSKVPAGRFLEVYLDVPVEECEKRDPKGLYAKARSGEIRGFTGIDAPYEPPENAEIVLPAVGNTPQQSAQRILQYLKKEQLIHA
jgi:adenylyl-sulfate kinase